MNPEKRTRLKDLLERTLEEFIRREEIQSDALEPALRFQAWHDRELASFLCSVLAYGRVSHIKKSIHKILDPMGDQPHQWLLHAKKTDIKVLCHGWSHRFNTARDMEIFLTLVKNIYLEDGSIEKFLNAGQNESTFEIIEKFVLKLEAGLLKFLTKLPAKNHSFWFFLPRPSQGSACKRMNLFLRWMVGKSALDMNLWTSMGTHQLMIPLDVHVLKQARSLKLTRRKNADWKAAEEVTAKLRLLDAADPTRFDFALCHLGMHGNILKNI